jgi:hypothetical protein
VFSEADVPGVAVGRRHVDRLDGVALLQVQRKGELWAAEGVGGRGGGGRWGQVGGAGRFST